MSEKKKDLALMDDEFVKELVGMVDEKDAKDAPKIPVLRINYDEDSKYPVGAWVLGQTKNEDGEIVEEGELVENIVILATRFRYFFYNQDDPSKSVNTKFFGANETPSDLEEVKAAVPAGEKLRFQVCVFGLALANKIFKEFVMYAHGVNYKPMMNYLEELTKVNTSKGKVEVPPFVFLTKLLPTIKKKKGSNPYYIMCFERGAYFNRDQVKIFEEKRKEVYDYINSVNNFKGSSGAKSEKTVGPASAKDFDARVGSDDVIDAEAKVIESDGAGGEDYDIEGAVMAALGGE